MKKTVLTAVVSVMLLVGISGPAPVWADSGSTPPRNSTVHMGQSLEMKTSSSQTPLARPQDAAPLAIPAGVPGIDVSFGQGNVDWDAQVSAGVKFAYILASEGTYATNSQFTTQYAGAQSAGVLRGSYHFANPSYSTGAVQAQYYVDHGGAWSPNSGTLPPLLDLENSPYGPNDCYGVSPAAMVSWIRDYSSTIASLMGRVPAIYTTQSWWQECTNSSTAFSNNPLFLARWEANPGALPASWDSYSFWQYSKTPPSGTALVGDQDVFNGSLTALQQLANVARAIAPTPSFSDVSTTNQFYKEITWLAASGISTGWVAADASRTYAPVTPVNRDAMAAFMYRFAGSPVFTAPTSSPFVDVTPSTQFYKEITWLAAQGISTGWDVGNGQRAYQPGGPVNRDAMAAFMYRLAGSPVFTAPTSSPFVDVTPSTQFYKEITWLAAQGISTGWDVGNGQWAYQPGSPVNRDAMAAFMYRLQTAITTPTPAS